MNLDNWTYVHMIGIGGIGMSALAQYFLDQGVKVTGYDRSRSRMTERLMDQGVKIYFEDVPHYEFGTPDGVVYTPAVNKSHPEFEMTRKCGVKTFKRSEILGVIAQSTRTIAVAGTHGKTTTSAMITSFLRGLKFDFTSIIGGWSTDINGNYFSTGRRWLVTEADEFDRSFLTLTPEIAIVNSLDPDHLDVYGSEQEMIQNYADFISRIKKGGRLIIRFGLFERLKPLIKNEELNVIQFGTEEEADYQILKITPEEGKMEVHWLHDDCLYRSRISLPGLHNAFNAIAAIAACVEARFSPYEVSNITDGFKGIHRRFEKRIEKNGIVVIDDYAHHPSEIDAAISAVKWMYPGRRVVGVFQSHTYTRTRDFMSEFAEVLQRLDAFYSCELYPAREEAIEGVSGRVLFDKVDLKEKVFDQREKLGSRIQFETGDVILVMGAGPIDSIIDDLKKRIEEE